MSGPSALPRRGVRETQAACAGVRCVGRDFELAVLDATWTASPRAAARSSRSPARRASARRGLLDEARPRTRDRVRFLEGRGVSYAQSFPYWPVRDLLRDWLRIGADDAGGARAPGAEGGARAGSGDEADDAYPFLADLLGAPARADEAQAIARAQPRERPAPDVRRLRELLYGSRREQPLCVVLDDLQWADSRRWSCSRRRSRVTEEASSALVFLYRAEREHRSWRLGERARQLYPHRYREIELRPLAGGAVEVLVGAPADGELPESVADLLVERAGGNPFFLEEALQRPGRARRADAARTARWKLAVAADELAVPALVQGALQAAARPARPRHARGRLARRGDRARLRPAAAREAPAARPGAAALPELQRLDLIVEKRRRPAPSTGSATGSSRRSPTRRSSSRPAAKLHRRVGEALEALYGDSREEVYELLARHFGEADEPEKAVEYLLAAGDAARAVYADQEALDHYRSARAFLARLGDERRARDTLFKMALAYHLAFDFEQAEKTYDEAFCCRVEDPRLRRPPRARDGAHPPDEISPGDVYTTEAARSSRTSSTGSSWSTAS